MAIEILRLLFDTGTFILIWIVQLAIYPSFQYYSKEQLINWHNQYTENITFIVMPLMLGQLTLCGLQLLYSLDWYSIASLGIIISLWISTFSTFVPLHNRISNSDYEQSDLVQLVQKNWLRTALWTLLLLLSIIYALLPEFY